MFNVNKAWLKKLLLSTDFGYKNLELHLKQGVTGTPKREPKINSENYVLKKKSEWASVVHEIRDIGLPIHPDLPKNWDCLYAVSTILFRTNYKAKILDAGADLNTNILPSLYLYGYRNLLGINLIFKKPLYRGAIRYEYGNIMETKLPNESVDVVTCISVIEHGVDIKRFFREMRRILIPGGILIVSTDYWDESVDTTGKFAYGAPVKIFNRKEILEVFKIAKKHNFMLTSDIDLSCLDKTVSWPEHDLDYTFLLFTMVKTA
ncbi:MAG: class I SAM-dependent methyltransferase [Desulfobacterales bacterium]|nr:class I SAM-dependent methyltransferase [Desulfobacterales bacterium]